MWLKTYPLQQNIIDLSVESFPAIAKIWQGDYFEFSAIGTHFGYIYAGNCLLLRQETGQSYNLHPGMYFCLPGGEGLKGIQPELRSPSLITKEYLMSAVQSSQQVSLLTSMAVQTVY